MARNENPPFERGTYDDQGAFAHLVGRDYLVEDEDWTNSNPGAKPTRSGKLVKIRLVKNSSGVALLPKHVVRYSVTAGEYGHFVDGDVRTDAQDWAGVVDEFLPSAGVPNGAYFFIVTEGPSKVITPFAAAAFNAVDITVGSLLVAATAATSQGTLPGRVTVANTASTSQATDYSNIINPVVNALGRALSAATTGNTNTDILADIGRW